MNKKMKYISFLIFKIKIILHYNIIHLKKIKFILYLTIFIIKIFEFDLDMIILKPTTKVSNSSHIHHVKQFSKLAQE